MSQMLIFIGLPLLVFIIFDSFATMKTALIVSIIAAFAEGIFTYVYFHEIDSVTLFSIGLVVVLALISYKKETSLFFKLKPAILNASVGIALIISYFTGHAILYEAVVKYKNFLPSNFSQALENPFFAYYLQVATIFSGIALLLHAGLTAFAAYKMSKWWWAVIQFFGFFLFLFIAGKLSQIYAQATFLK